MRLRYVVRFRMFGSDSSTPVGGLRETIRSFRNLYEHPEASNLRIVRVRDSERRKAMSRRKIIALAAVVLIGAPFAFGVVSALNSVTTAPARVLNKTLQTDNIISNYEYYHDAYGRFQARVSQVGQFQGFLAGETNAAEQRRLRIDMAAIQQSCRELAEQYNANSRKLNRGIFRGWSLPETLDQADCG